MRKLDQEAYLKLSTDVERGTGLSPLDFQMVQQIQQIYENESLPTKGN